MNQRTGYFCVVKEKVKAVEKKKLANPFLLGNVARLFFSFFFTEISYIDFDEVERDLSINFPKQKKKIYKKF